MRQITIYILMALLFATLQTFAQTYEYDANNQLTKVSYPDGSTVTFTYDELGNRLSMKKTAGLEKEFIHFTDPIVKSICIENWDEDGDGELSNDEAAAVTDLGVFFQEQNITNFDELHFFTGLTKVGEEAFSNCSELTSISFPSSLKEIGDNAFYGCSSLLHLTIPKNVNSIGVSAFSLCTELESIVIEEENTTYDSRDNCNAIIKKESNSLIVGCKNTIIPKTVSIIDDFAFVGTNDLTSITIPTSVTIIGNYAFYGCKGLTSINIPIRISGIGSCAFSECTNLESIYSDVEEPFRLHESSFQNWDPNTSTTSFTTATLYVPAGTREAYLATPAWNQFLTIVEMEPEPEEEGIISFADNLVKTICVENWDQDGDGKLSYDEAAAVTELGGKLFEGENITSFNELQYFTGLTKLPSYSFYSCEKLTSITLPHTLTELESFVFSYCSSLESITIPKSLSKISIWPFSYCSSLASIVVEEGNPVFDSREKCNAIIQTSNNCMIVGCQNTIIPNTVKSLQSTFMGMSNLTSITIPNSVKTIDYYTFRGCTGLTSITIPSSVTNIGSYAFNGCDNLESVYTEIQEPFTIEENVFQFWDPNTSSTTFSKATLYVPAGTREAYLATPAWNKFLSIIETDPIGTIGDVDGDGDVTSTDITALLGIIFDNNSGEPSHKTADVNGDGTIDIADITALVNIILGKRQQ